ncbi:MAG: hypothetical protein GY817_06410, partial [bacterium]|nr:hypothetical protein [bacterium]
MTTVRQLLANSNINVDKIEKMAIISQESIKAFNNLPAVQDLNKTLKTTTILSYGIQKSLNGIAEQHRNTILNALNTAQQISKSYDHLKNINFLMPQHRIIEDEDIDENNIYTPKPQIIQQNNEIL